jgi:Arc/MetJ-type ribon-helix-helix transcriptional regulator
MRTHVVLPDGLVRDIDSLVGKRKRSRFVEEAVREKLRSEALLKAIEDTAGALLPDAHPEWSTSGKAASWVRESRRRDDRRAAARGRG